MCWCEFGNWNERGKLSAFPLNVKCENVQRLPCAMARSPPRIQCFAALTLILKGKETRQGGPGLNTTYNLISGNISGNQKI